MQQKFVGVGNMQLDPTRNLANRYLQSDTTSSTGEYNIKLARFVRFCQLMQLAEQKETQAAWVACEDRKVRWQLFQMWIDNDGDIAAAFTKWQLQMPKKKNNDKDIGVHQTMQLIGSGCSAVSVALQLTLGCSSDNYP